MLLKKLESKTGYVREGAHQPPSGGGGRHARVGFRTISAPGLYLASLWLFSAMLLLRSGAFSNERMELRQKTPLRESQRRIDSYPHICQLSNVTSCPICQLSNVASCPIFLIAQLLYLSLNTIEQVLGGTQQFRGVRELINTYLYDFGMQIFVLKSAPRESTCFFTEIDIEVKILCIYLVKGLNNTGSVCFFTKSYTMCSKYIMGFRTFRLVRGW